MRLICVEYIEPKTSFDVIWLKPSSIYETKIISEIIKNNLSSEVQVDYYFPKLERYNRKKGRVDISIGSQKELRNYCLSRKYRNIGLGGIIRIDIIVPKGSISIIKKISKTLGESGYPGYYLSYTDSRDEINDIYFIDGTEYRNYEGTH